MTDRASAEGHRYDHDGMHRHHHEYGPTGRAIWWEYADQFGGDLTEHTHADRASAEGLHTLAPHDGCRSEDCEVEALVRRLALRDTGSRPDSGIEALRALSDAATPGKWHSKADELQRQWSKEEKRTGGRAFRYLENGGVSTSVIERRDADFLAACANYVRERLSTPRTETSDRIENGWSEYDAPPPGDSDR